MKNVKENSLSDFLRRCDRRTFLKACGALGLGAASGAALPAVFDALRLDARRLKVTQTRLRMGTSVTMTAVHESRDLAEEAIGRAFEEMDRLIAILSRHDTATAVSVLNRDGAVAGPPPELLAVLDEARALYHLSDGAFDVTVKPLCDLVAGTVGAGKAAPERAEIEAALAHVGFDGVDVDRGRVRFKTAGMGITLDGVAKGYIVDRASDVIVRRGVGDHLINAGGDIRARGTRAAGRPWRIAVQNPARRGHTLDVIELRDGAVATSGDYEIYYDEQRVFHHVVDPRSGVSPQHGTSASVIAESVMRADALSTAVFVLEPTEGTRLIDDLQDAHCMLLTRGGARFESMGWRAATTGV